MAFDADRYREEALPQLLMGQLDPEDLIVRYGIEGPVGTVPDSAHIMMLRSIWASALSVPEYVDLIKFFMGESVPQDDADFWAKAWSDHLKRGPGTPTTAAPSGAGTENETVEPEGDASASAAVSVSEVTVASAALADVRLALDDGEPTQARRLLNSIKATMSEVEATEAQRLRTAIDERHEEAAQLLSEANDVLAPPSGQPTPADLERAGEILMRALDLDRRDERVAQALSRIPAPAPRDVATRVVRDSVLISWTPAPYRYGSVTYEVLRAPTDLGEISPLTATVIGQTDGEELTDAAQPGLELRYGVVARREGGKESAVVASDESVMVLADVTDLRIQFDAGVVRGTWRRAERCHRVEVSRGDDDESAALTEGVRADGFSDPGAGLDRDRSYTVRSIYLVNGRELSSPGRSVLVSPKDAPDPVEEIESKTDGDRYVITWTTPAAGEVTLRRMADRPGFSVGDRMDLAEIASTGETVSEPIEVGHPKSRITLLGANGMAWYLPITTAGGAAVAGQPVLVNHLRPVDLLEATRQGEELIVSWVWPDDASDVRVAVTYQGSTVFTRTASRAEVDREGGIHVAIGPEAAQVHVVALGPVAQGRRPSPASIVIVPARAPTVFYEATKRGGQTMLRIEADRDCRVSRLVVVGQRRRRPSAIHDGEELAVVDGLDLQVGEVTHEPIGKIGRGVELACFPGPHDAVLVRAGTASSYWSDRNR